MEGCMPKGQDDLLAGLPNSASPLASVVIPIPVLLTDMDCVVIHRYLLALVDGFCGSGENTTRPAGFRLLRHTAAEPLDGRRNFAGNLPTTCPTLEA